MPKLESQSIQRNIGPRTPSTKDGWLGSAAPGKYNLPPSPPAPLPPEGARGMWNEAVHGTRAEAFGVKERGHILSPLPRLRTLGDSNQDTTRLGFDRAWAARANFTKWSSRSTGEESNPGKNHNRQN